MLKFEAYHGDYYVYLRYEDGKTLVISPDGAIHTLDRDEEKDDFSHVAVTNLHAFLWELIDQELDKAEITK